MKWFLSALLALCLPVLALAAVSPDDENYVLGRNDVVRVTVYDHPDMTTEAQIGNEGTVSFPLIGKVRLAGLTSSAAEASISNALRTGGFIKNPNVNLVVVSYKSQRISILGQVNKPGLYTLDGGTTLEQALATAGGIAPSGGERIVLVRGNTPQTLMLDTYLTGGKTILVRAGDVLYVPKADQIYVYGEVNRPGVYRLEPGMTAIQAIAAAGGFNLRADDDDLKVTRMHEGRPQVFRLKAYDAVEASDVIFVGESLF